MDEARLGREEFGGEVHAFAAGWTEEELDELLPLVDHLVFNSLAQWERFGPKVRAWCRDNGREISCGLRINPEHSEGAVAIYNPCSPGSRLGIRPHQLPETLPEGISGLHFPYPVRTGLRRAGTHPGCRGGPFRQAAGPVQVDQFRRRPSHHP